MAKVQTVLLWYRIAFSNPQIPCLLVQGENAEIESGWITIVKKMPGHGKPTSVFMGRCKDILSVVLVESPNNLEAAKALQGV